MKNILKSMFLPITLLASFNSESSNRNPLDCCADPNIKRATAIVTNIHDDNLNGISVDEDDSDQEEETKEEVKQKSDPVENKVPTYDDPKSNKSLNGQNETCFGHNYPINNACNGYPQAILPYNDYPQTMHSQDIYPQTMPPYNDYSQAISIYKALPPTKIVNCEELYLVGMASKKGLFVPVYSNKEATIIEIGKKTYTILLKDENGVELHAVIKKQN